MLFNYSMFFSTSFSKQNEIMVMKEVCKPCDPLKDIVIIINQLEYKYNKILYKFVQHFFVLFIKPISFKCYFVIISYVFVYKTIEGKGKLKALL